MIHWTKAQRWRELNTHEIVTAAELIGRYSKYLRVNRVSLIDKPADQGIRMEDNTIWYRYSDEVKK